MMPRPSLPSSFPRLLRNALGALAFAAALAPAPAMGQDVATRSAARKLGEEGSALFDKGQYAEALQKYNLADQLVPAPTFGLRAARCLVKLGKLVEASERYLAVTRMEIDAKAPAAFRKAQADALTEREQLASRIPSLTVDVSGPRGKGIEVFIDREQIPLALLGQRRPTNPGQHDLEVRRGKTRVARQVKLEEGQQTKEVLELPALPPPPTEPNPVWKAVGWVGIGVGVGGTVAFGVNGLLALRKERELLAVCPSRKCGPSNWEGADVYDTLRAATTVGLVAGVVGFAVGIPLVVSTPRRLAQEPAKDTAFQWAPYIGPGSVGVAGVF
jgi:hypothetical protein